MGGSSGDKITSWPSNEPVTVKNFLDYIETRHEDLYKGQIQYIHRLQPREATLVRYKAVTVHGDPTLYYQEP